MPLVYSACSTIHLTMYSSNYAESFGRTLFSAVRSSAMTALSPIDQLAMRGGLDASETKLACAIQSIIDARKRNMRA